MPITNSQLIADATQMSHAAILKHIRTESYSQLAKYRLSSGEMYDYMRQPHISLRETQAMQIFQHLKRTNAINEVEAELTRQFYEAKRTLNERRQQRTKCIAARRDCIELKQIKGMSDTDDLKRVDLAYQMAFGKKKQEYRNACGIFSGKKAVDYMSADDLEALTKAQKAIAKMIRAGRNYEYMKSQVLKRTADDDNTPECKIGNPFWSYIVRKFRPLLPCDRCNREDDAA